MVPCHLTGASIEFDVIATTATGPTGPISCGVLNAVVKKEAV